MNKFTYHSFLLLLISVLVVSCYNTPEIPDFNYAEWTSFEENCNDYRVKKGVELILKHQDVLLSQGQNEIINALGSPSRHQLFNRNQKMFFYDLDCDGKVSLRLRFDALGRLKNLEKINSQ